MACGNAGSRPRQRKRRVANARVLESRDCMSKTSDFVAAWIWGCGICQPADTERRGWGACHWKVRMHSPGNAWRQRSGLAAEAMRPALLRQDNRLWSALVRCRQPAHTAPMAASPSPFVPGGHATPWQRPGSRTRVNPPRRRAPPFPLRAALRDRAEEASRNHTGGRSGPTPARHRGLRGVPRLPAPSALRRRARNGCTRSPAWGMTAGVDRRAAPVGPGRA